tara:strand:+ start:4054 stop:4857 length:804 start_codon:yes stop_codon:yes gene_type:complete
MIPEQFTKTYALYDRLNKIKDDSTVHWDMDDIRWDTWEFEIQTNDETGHPFSYDIAESFDEEYNLLIDEQKYFFGCPFAVYQKTYTGRLGKYLENNKLDLFTEQHFIDEELRLIEKNTIPHYLNDLTKDKLKQSFVRQKEFLVERKTNLNKQSLDDLSVSNDTTKDISSKETNPFPRIFINNNAYRLFEGFGEHIRDKYKLADYSFIYRQMQKDKLIFEYVGDSEFTSFLFDEYGVTNIVKTKQLSNCTTLSKKNIYSSLKDLNKPY